MFEVNKLITIKNTSDFSEQEKKVDLKLTKRDKTRSNKKNAGE